MRRIVITSNNSGGGHKATANALIEIIRRQNRPWDVEILDLDASLEAADPYYLVCGTHSCEIWNWMARCGITMGSRYLLMFVHSVLAALYPVHVALLRRRWRALRPDLVLSITPHFNRALFTSLRREFPTVPFATMPTDFIDHPPRFWFERLDQDIICGIERAATQALDFISDPSRLWRVNGMVLHPRFSDPIEEDRATARAGLGLAPDVPTIAVFFGGSGSPRMVEVARKLAISGLRVQLILLCGRNEKLVARLRGLDLPFPIHVEGFTTELPRFFWMSDGVIGKPGPGAISEALAMGLPVIVQTDWRTLDHERYNAQWLVENGVGISGPPDHGNRRRGP